MNSHPQISELYKIYKAETKSPFRKVHRMIDLFETIIKTHTIVIMAEYFKRNKLSDEAKGLLAGGLRTPALGHWQLFSRVLFEELQKDKFQWIVNDFAENFVFLDKELMGDKKLPELFTLANINELRKKRKESGFDYFFDDVITLRNGYAHGATPEDVDCEKDIKQFEQFLELLLASSWLKNSDIIEKEGKAILISLQNKQELSLHPLLIVKAEETAQPFAFFNDLKDDKVGLLNYPLSKHYREKEFFSEFNTYLPLKEWKKTGSSEFNQRIDELTETFKGRIKERETIRQFVETKNKGYFSIQGNPGIGKSALIAQVYIDLTHKEANLPIQLVPYFIRRGTAQADSLFLINYLIKNTDHYFVEGRNIKAEGKTNWDLQQQLFNKWRAYGESEPKNKLVFLIDGLDEGIENEILRYLPRENFNQVLVIYGSRPGGHKELESFWSELPVEHHSSILLSGLSKNDIRALLYEVANKYEIEKDSEWIAIVEKRSEGNPLYLKLLCNAIENGSIHINDPKALPKEIDEYYKTILNRYANNINDGDAFLSSLYIFAAAVDYLTPIHLSAILQLSEAQTLRVESTLKEVLYENPLTEDVLDYQLFHESFREYLVKTKATAIKQAETKILDYCSKWNELAGTWEQRYTLQHYVKHLCKNSSKENINILLALGKNTAYTNLQKKVLRNFDATKELYKNILTTCIENNKNEEAINASLALVDIKYEEKNDAANIVEMVVNNEIDLALQRITSFGGPSAEEKQRQFILIMLCLMQLTLLKSKEQPWRKIAISKLLVYLEEQIPVDHSILNWNIFFPSYLMFLIAVEIQKLEIDYYEIYKRTSKWNIDWIITCDDLNEKDFLILEKQIEFVNDEWTQDSLISKIAIQLCKQNHFDYSIKIAKEMRLNHTRSNTFISLIEILKEKSMSKEANNLKKEIIIYPGAMSREFKKNESSLITNISSLDIMNDFQKTIDSLNKNEKDVLFLLDLSSELISNGRLEYAVKSLKKAEMLLIHFDDKFFSSESNISISAKFQQLNLIDESNKILDIVSSNVKYIENIKLRDRLCQKVAYQLAINGNYMKSIDIIKSISLEHYKILTNKEIVGYLSQNKKIEVANSYFLNSLQITNDSNFNISLLLEFKYSISKNINNNIKAEKILRSAFDDTFSIVDNSGRANWRLKILVELSKYLSIENILFYIENIKHRNNNIDLLLFFARDLFSIGKNYESEIILNLVIDKINDSSEKDWSLGKLALELVNQKRINNIDKIISDIKSQNDKIAPLSKLALLYLNNNQINKGNHLLDELLESIDKQAHVMDRVYNIEELAESFFKANRIKELTSKIVNGKLFLLVSKLYWDENDVNNAKTNLFKAFELINKSSDSIDISNVALEFTKQGFIENALKLLAFFNDKESDISLTDKSRNLKDVSVWLFQDGQIELAIEITKLITRLSTYYKTYSKFGRIYYNIQGIQNLDRILSIFPNSESKKYLIKGLIESIEIENATENVILQMLKYCYDDSESIERLIQMHSLYLTFFENTPKEKLNAFNKTLNIQWALDIKAKFPIEEFVKSSSNMQDWINEIKDEDDREDIISWAEKVKEGKMTEDKFMERVNKKLN